CGERGAWIAAGNRNRDANLIPALLLYAVISVCAGPIWALGKVEDGIHHPSAAHMNFQKFRLPLLTLLALAAAVAVVVRVRPSAREPAYQGRPLCAWLEEFDQG